MKHRKTDPRKCDSCGHMIQSTIQGGFLIHRMNGLLGRKRVSDSPVCEGSYTQQIPTEHTVGEKKVLNLLNKKTNLNKVESLILEGVEEMRSKREKRLNKLTLEKVRQSVEDARAWLEQVTEGRRRIRLERDSLEDIEIDSTHIIELVNKINQTEASR